MGLKNTVCTGPKSMALDIEGHFNSQCTFANFLESITENIILTLS